MLGRRPAPVLALLAKQVHEKTGVEVDHSGGTRAGERRRALT